MSIARHKVFISYYHADDQLYKNRLANMRYFDLQQCSYISVFDDYSVRNGDINDANRTAESIRREIRDDFMQDATVLVLLCGANTKRRKHIDWEIHTAMYHSDLNPQMGILVINLPSAVGQCSRACDDSEKSLVGNPFGNWHISTTREEFNRDFPYMPERIIDNFVNGAKISVVDWNVISNSPEKLMKLIDNAFERRFENNYDHSRPLRSNNS